MALSLKMHLDQLGECAASEQAKRTLMLKMVLPRPFQGRCCWGTYRGLRPRLLPMAPPAPQTRWLGSGPDRESGTPERVHHVPEHVSTMSPVYADRGEGSATDQ